MEGDISWSDIKKSFNDCPHYFISHQHLLLFKVAHHVQLQDMQDYCQAYWLNLF